MRKVFLFNTKLGELFSTKIIENSSNNNIYFARLISKSFCVVFDQNKNGFFKSEEINQVV